MTLDRRINRYPPHVESYALRDQDYWGWFGGGGEGRGTEVTQDIVFCPRYVNIQCVTDTRLCRRNESWSWLVRVNKTKKTRQRNRCCETRSRGCLMYRACNRETEVANRVLIIFFIFFFLHKLTLDLDNLIRDEIRDRFLFIMPPVNIWKSNIQGVPKSSSF